MNKKKKESTKNEIISLATDGGTGVLTLFDPVSGVVTGFISNSIRKASDIRAKRFLTKLEKLLQEDSGVSISKYFEKLKS